jgi:hypothetical protein
MMTDRKQRFFTKKIYGFLDAKGWKKKKVKKSQSFMPWDIPFKVSKV